MFRAAALALCLVPALAFADDAAIRRALEPKLGGVKIEGIQPAPLAGLFEVRFKSAEGVYFFAAGRVEIAAVHILPVAVCTEGILTDEQTGALFHSVVGTPFADADEAGIGFDQNDVGALVEEGLAGVGAASGIRGSAVVTDAFDFGFGKASGIGAVCKRGGAGSGENGIEEGSTIHDLTHRIKVGTIHEGIRYRVEWRFRSPRL